MSSSPLLNAELLREAFRRLDFHLSRANVNADIFVFGGAAMILGYDARPATRDVDALWRPHGAVLKAAWQVADEMGLLRSWLNEQASAYVPGPPNWSGKTLFAGRSLRVVQAAPEMLLAMKVRAGREVDLHDVVVLASHLGLATSHEILALATAVLGEEIPLRQRQLIEERFDMRA